jgi:hypothetical protein
MGRSSHGWGSAPGVAGLAIATILATTALTPTSTAAQDYPISSALPPESRQFDFWVGQWAGWMRSRRRPRSTRS